MSVSSVIDSASRSLVDPTKTGRIATILVWLWLATDVAYGVAALYTISVLGGFGGAIAPMPQLRASDTATGLIAGITGIAFLVAGVAVLRWIYLTNRNAHAANPAMAISPGWAVGWFFVPIANLWKPFTGIRETWATAVDPQAPAAVPVPALLRWWWGCWVVTSILGNIQFRLSMAAQTPPRLITASWATVVAVPIDIVLTIALTTIIRRLSQMQRATIALPAGLDAIST